MFRRRGRRREKKCEKQIEKITGISAESVRRRVRAGISDDGMTQRYCAARGNGRRRRFRRSACIAAVVMILICLSAMAFAGIPDFRTLFWERGAEKVKDTGSLPGLENEDIRFAVEDAVSDDSVLYLVFSLESLSEEGRKIIEENPAWVVMNMMEYSGGSSSAERAERPLSGIRCSPLKELNKGRKKYFRAEITLNGAEKISFRMEEGGEKIEVPAELNPESLRFELFTDREAEDRIAGTGGEIPEEAGLAGNGWILKEIVVTKLSYRVTCLVRKDGSAPELPWIEIVYTDGSSQPLAEISGGSYSADTAGKKQFYEINDFGTFKEIRNMEDIKAVRIAGKEYFPVR